MSTKIGFPQFSRYPLIQNQELDESCTIFLIKTQSFNCISLFRTIKAHVLICFQFGPALVLLTINRWRATSSLKDFLPLLQMSWPCLDHWRHLGSATDHRVRSAIWTSFYGALAWTRTRSRTMRASIFVLITGCIWWPWAYPWRTANEK